MAENLSKEKRKSDVFEVAGKRLRVKPRQLIHDKMGEDDEDVVEEGKDETVGAHEGEKKADEAGKGELLEEKIEKKNEAFGEKDQDKNEGHPKRDEDNKDEVLEEKDEEEEGYEEMKRELRVMR